MTNPKNKSFEVTVVFDNRGAKEGFKMGFGFAALIRKESTGEYFLFDTGGNGTILSHNIKELGVEMSVIKAVVISHAHMDHAGGLDEIVRNNSKIKIYVPMRSSAGFNSTYPEADITPVDELLEIEENVFSSGQFGTNFTEQCLYLKNDKGEIIILVGCTHPGLAQFITKAKELGPIKAVIGGFHGFRKFSYLEGIDFIGACHCTQHGAKIKKKFPENFRQVIVGETYSF